MKNLISFLYNLSTNCWNFILYSSYMDIFGHAVRDYYSSQEEANIIVGSKTMEDDIIPVKYLFRGFDEMPLIEKKAIEITKGKVLEIGGCVGSHALILQKTHNLQLLELSSGAIEIAQKRGVQNTINQNIFQFETDEKFDTILLLMNGIGVAETIEGLKLLLKKLCSMLTANGQLVFDSTDIMYTFDNTDIRIQRKPTNKYYGIVEYQMMYKDLKGDWFKWIYLDFKTLESICKELNLNCCKVFENENHYLVHVSIN